MGGTGGKGGGMKALTFSPATEVVSYRPMRVGWLGSSMVMKAGFHWNWRYESLQGIFFTKPDATPAISLEARRES